MQRWLLSDIPIKSYEMLNTAMYDIIPNSFTEIWALKDCIFCVLLWTNQEENVPKCLFPSKFSLKKVFAMIAFDMKNI